jgi:hypothetical protein
MIVTGICIALYSDLDFIAMLFIGNGVLGSLTIVYIGMFFHNLRAPEVFIGMVTNCIICIAMQLIRMFPMVDECAQCELEGNPYGGMSRQGPGLPFPMGVGDPDESLLWLLPPFWGFLVSLGVTFVAHVTLLTLDPDATIEAWFERTFGFPEKILAAYGTERMHKDREGTMMMLK